MPTFFRKSVSPSSSHSLKKRFVTRPAVSAEPKKKPKNVKQGDSVPLEPKQIINDFQPNKFVKPVQNSYIASKADATINSLNSLLNENPKPSQSVEAKKTEKISNPQNENAVYHEESEVAEFNGVSDLHEQEELYSHAVAYEKKKAKVIEEELKMASQEHDAEKRALQKEIHELKQELHRTTPIHDNKFFSLSKQLRDAVVEIERIASDSGIYIQNIPAVLPVPEPVKPPVTDVEALPVQPTNNTLTPVPVVKPTQESQPIEKVVNSPTPAESKQLSKKKTLITGAIAIFVIISMSVIGINAVKAKPKVDQKLVSKYLDQPSGQVQGAQTTKPIEEDASQANVTFDQAVWEDFKDPMFGVMLQYPKNAVKAIHTESNITFIRKTGYLFKIQRIETALTLDEYWKQIKATSLNYNVTEDKFKGMPSLKLQLQDTSDYPGDRVLVKQGNFIYDIWYATPSNNFSKDDIQLSEKMLASLSVVGIK